MSTGCRGHHLVGAEFEPDGLAGGVVSYAPAGGEQLHHLQAPAVQRPGLSWSPSCSSWAAGPTPRCLQRGARAAHLLRRRRRQPVDRRTGCEPTAPDGRELERLRGRRGDEPGLGVHRTGVRTVSPAGARGRTGVVARAERSRGVSPGSSTARDGPRIWLITPVAAPSPGAAPRGRRRAAPPSTMRGTPRRG